MLNLLKRMTKKTKLAALWVRRILFAPDHFGVSPFIRLSMSAHGFVADQYVLYGLKDRRRMKEFLSEFDWYKSRWIDEPFDAMFNNKIVCAKVLSPYVLVPETLAVKNKGEIILCSESFETEVADVFRVMDLVRKNASVFVKPISAGKGKGVHRIDWNDGEYVLDGAVVCSSKVESLLSDASEWVLCESVRQSRYLSDLYSRSTNTVRLITLRNPKTQLLEVFFAVQRIGTSSTGPVDNGSRGGLIACIDLETGRLSEAKTLRSLDSYRVHPDTGALIEGFCIPDWDAMKETALRLAHVFPYVPFIAWDLLSTDEGVCVIEANASSGVNIIQLWGPQKQGKLGDFYRSRGVTLQ